MAIGALLPRAVAAQDPLGGLDGRVSPEVSRAVRAIAAARSSLPVEPLVQKAIEGSAKGVPDDRVIAAVRALSERLGQAADLLRQPGVAAPARDVVEGVFEIGRRDGPALLAFNLIDERLLKKRTFCWERDGEELMRRRKASSS